MEKTLDPKSEKHLQMALEQAEKWQNLANTLLTPEEKAEEEKMLHLLNNPMDKATLVSLFDQCFRSKNTVRISDQLYYLLKRNGQPKFFSGFEKILLKAYMKIGRHMPGISIPQVKKKIRQDTQNVIIPEEEDVLKKHLKTRRSEGIRANLNQLGELVLGEGEAGRRLTHYLEALADPEIEYISVKISSIFSQLHPLGHENSAEVLKERMATLYRASKETLHIRPDGTKVPKFVNLDMEEYRDTELTLEVFMETLDMPQFHDFYAGIVLQAYLPDSSSFQKRLTEWAKKRLEQGRAPIKLRIVKGANLQMETVESSLRDWPNPVYDNKIDVDANYKRMMGFAMLPENIKAVNLGIASHNLFDLAYAWILVQEYQVAEWFTFEMLEGMAGHIRRAIAKDCNQFLLYTPVAAEDQFLNAISYLIRRLDENTGEDNFLRHSFGMTVNSTEWNFLQRQFITAFERKDTVNNQAHRTQDRKNETFDESMGSFKTGEFENDSDTDWYLPANQVWKHEIREKWENTSLKIPVKIAGEVVQEERATADFYDHSKTEKVHNCSVALANVTDIKKAVETAKEDPTGWRKTSLKERHELLSKVAVELRKKRGDLIGIMAAITGKTFVEGDVEVTEAIDFAEYYPHSLKYFMAKENLEFTGKGVGLVLAPWNFPTAIPAGGVLASLAAGNTVILKPAPEAFPIAFEFAQCFWDAGIPEQVFQVIACEEGEPLLYLANHPDIDFTIFTGGTDTALKIMEARPDITFSAETGGKNATIVSAMSDRDQAAANVLYSAFGNSGQKCSATSLLLLEREVYNDELFKRQLKDAVESYQTGSAWNFSIQMGPIIHPPAGNLKRGMEELAPGESWLVEPKNLDNNPYLWTPSVKWGVKPDSFCHKNELFGPVLSVMCVDSLEEAIEIVNSTGFGLTSGLESLDEREHEIWKEKIFAGNLYINRGTTGAIVLRQPFGGMGLSAFGLGIKAGGPNYVAQFMNVKEVGEPSSKQVQGDQRMAKVARRWQAALERGEWAELREDLKKVIQAIHSYLYQMDDHFSKETDFVKLYGQDNSLRYLPVGNVLIRLHHDDSLFDALAMICGARIAGCKLLVSCPHDLSNNILPFLQSEEAMSIIKPGTLAFHTEDELIEKFPKTDRIRCSRQERVSEKIFKAAAKAGMYIARNTPLAEGRLELLQYLKEQSISANYHRYGNIGEREWKN